MADSIRFIINQERFTNRLRRFVSEFERDADRAVFEATTDVLSDIVEGWPVDQGISRAAWRGPTKGDKRLSWRLTNPLPYAPVIEYGGYPGVGPKTEQGGGITLPGSIRIDAGIFPSQKPHAPVRRSLSQNRNAISVRVQEAMRRRWGV